MHPAEFDEITSRLLDGDCPPADAGRLRAACENDPALLERFAARVANDRLLGLVLAGKDGASRFAAEAVTRIRADAGPLPGSASPTGFVRGVSRRITLRKRRTRQAAFALAAAVTLVAGTALLFSLQRPRTVLVRSEAADWSGPAPSTGHPVTTGELMTLEAGLVELDFGSHVHVLVEGPAAFKVNGPGSMWLDHGRIFADVTSPAGKGFTVDGPGGRIVDHGTRFGVAADPGGEMEVHVLQGLVETRPAKAGESVVSLRQNEGLRFDRSEVRRIPAEESEFLTSLPPVTSPDAGYILWKFDEPAGDLCLNSGSGLAPDLATARMQGDSPPVRISGPRGGAVSFDGRGGFLDSPFKGIPGSGARTVALWARIPPDLRITESYALIGWGDVSGEGTAWQISINPDPLDGPPGCLRAGTGRGAVVGSTDLRDGRWHHLAVVMYGGPDASTATHVLLYVDGELESTTRKSVREIRTDIDAVDHGIWIGRNLSVNSSSPPDAYFFRGEIDELLLMDTALDQKAIRRFMR